MSSRKENPNREKRYLLKEGYFVDMYGRKIGRDEMTDEMAEEFLRRHPGAVGFFELTPSTKPVKKAQKKDIDNG